LREAVESIVEQAPRIHLVLDFRHVRFLSSAVLGLLIRISACTSRKANCGCVIFIRASTRFSRSPG
jgi:anti-anti-sigma regulatory factor